MVKFQFEGLEANDLRQEQKIKKLFREMVKFQFCEPEGDDIRREQMHFLRKESHIALRCFSLFYLSPAPIRILLPTFRAGFLFNLLLHTQSHMILGVS